MNKIQKATRLLLALSVVAIAAACNNAPAPSAETKTAADSPVAVQPVAPAPMAAPMDVMEVSHTVKDYSKWRPGFDSTADMRKQAGLEFMTVGQEADKPNNLIVVFKVDDIQKAKDFGASPELKAAMQKHGVISKPEMNMYHVLRLHLDSTQKSWVMVDHKVKDFNAWLKVFDAEGPAKRAGEGLTDVALCRSLSDSMMVHLVFYAADVAKAKTTMMSEGLKKTMMEAGVIGKPKIVFYNDAH